MVTFMGSKDFKSLLSRWYNDKFTTLFRLKKLFARLTNTVSGEAYTIME